MWICSKLGFYSIVSTHHGTTEFQVRGRFEQDLENLKNAVPDLEFAKILTTPDADYRYRMIVNERQLVKIMIELERSIDYTNFKAMIWNTPDQRTKMAVYNDFHEGMEQIQE